MRYSRFLLIVMLTCVVVLPALAQQETPTPAGPATSAESTPEMAMNNGLASLNTNPFNLAATDSIVFVRFAHVAPDAGPVDVYIQELSDSPIVEGLAFGDVTGFVLLPPGSYNVATREAGSGIEGDAISLMNWDYQPDTSWLVAYAGLASDASLQVEPINLLRNDIAGDQARVRIVNLVPGGAVLSLADGNGATLGPALGWMGIYDADMAPGTMNMNVSSAEGRVLLSDASADLTTHALNTLLLAGGADSNQPVQVVSFASPAYVSRVQFVNNGSEPLQLFRRPGNTELVTSLAPGATSDWINVPSGAVTFVAYAPGTGPTSQELGAWIGTLSPMRDQAITFMAEHGADESDAVFSPDMADGGNRLLEAI